MSQDENFKVKRFDLSYKQVSNSVVNETKGKPAVQAHNFEVSSPKLTLAICAAELGLVNHGINIALFNAPTEIIQDFLKYVHEIREGEPLHPETLHLLWSLLVTLYPIGVLLSSYLGSVCGHLYGRKRSIVWNSSLGMLAAVLMGISSFIHSHEALMVGRFLMGFHSGLNISLCTIYASEISLQKYKDKVWILNEIGVGLGLIIAQTLGLLEILGTPLLWPVLVGITGLCPLFQLILLQCVPESPQYLVCKLNDIDGTAAGLKELIASESNPSANRILNKAIGISIHQPTEITIKGVFKDKGLRRSLVLIIVLNIFHQLMGHTAILYYSTSLFTAMGLKVGIAKLASLGIGWLYFSVTMLVIFIFLHKFTPGNLNKFGLRGMIGSGIFFTVSFSLGVRYHIFVLLIVAVVFSQLIVVCFVIGPGYFPVLVINEIFPQEACVSAMHIGGFVNKIFLIVGVFIFPYLQISLKSFVMVPFTVITIFNAIYLRINLPKCTASKESSQRLTPNDKTHQAKDKKSAQKVNPGGKLKGKKESHL